jgi:hypothetical protein
MDEDGLRILQTLHIRTLVYCNIQDATKLIFICHQVRFPICN